MFGIGNYGAAAEFSEARYDFGAACQETCEANQHFANARADFQEADSLHLKATGMAGTVEDARKEAQLRADGRQELAMGRQDLAEAGQDRAEGRQHLEQGYADQAMGFFGPGAWF